MDIDATRYPRTAAAFAQMDAAEHYQRITQMDAVWQGIRARVASGVALDTPPVWREIDRSAHAALAARATWHGDLVYAGAGLGLLHAVEMARRGFRVSVFDRGVVGCAHREWNITRPELQALVDSGGWTWAELDTVVMNEYRDGLVRFFREKDAVTLHLPEVLTVALDAGALLALARQKLLAMGADIRDGCVLVSVSVTAHSGAPVLTQLRGADGTDAVVASRLVIDGMGTVSPLSLQRHAGRPYTGVCPTVGTVASGFREGAAPELHDRTVGDILLTVADAQRTQQYMWEGFPGRDDELTVYLFYYDTLHPGRPQTRPNPTLLELFEDYFTLLHTYKPDDGALHHHKPVYGYIPARHSLRRSEAPLLRGVLPIGDAAAQQSPLTFCGFGSHVRNLPRTTELLAAVLAAGREHDAELALVTPFQVNVSLNWVFSRFMQPWGWRDDDVNHLMNLFMGVLQRNGTAFATRYFRDMMRWSDYHKMVLGMLFAYPRIVLVAGHVLGWRGCVQWVADYVRYSWSAIGAAAARAVGYTLLERIAADLPVQWRLRIAAQLGEWRVMGWDR